jgi:hypothetical protein
MYYFQTVEYNWLRKNILNIEEGTVKCGRDLMWKTSLLQNEKVFYFRAIKKGPDENPARSLSNIQVPFGTRESPSGL